LTVRASDLTSQADGSTRTFTVPVHTRVIQVSTVSFPYVYRPTIDFTSAGTTLTLTSEVDPPPTGDTLLFTYAI